MSGRNLPSYVVWPAILLLGLFVAVSTWWYVVLIGGDPYDIKTIAILNKSGKEQRAFRAGELVAIKRLVCTNTRVGGESFPALINHHTGFRFTFAPSLVLRDPGCRVAIYAFTMPDLPAGRYAYSNTIRFQNNLIGRDEYTIVPPIDIEVTQ